MSKAKELLESLAKLVLPVEEKANSYTTERSEHRTMLVKHEGNTVGRIQHLDSGKHKAEFKNGKHWHPDSKIVDSHEKALDLIKKNHKALVKPYKSGG